ncbi:MAG: DNA repair protein RecO [Patescibacteria group bacterium]|nr:DNA repair protein RecO [Patescibacteria group bacterium]
MESTFNTRAIILNRLDFRENDSRIVCYSEDKGKLELIARGAKKVKSKLSGHIESLTLSRLMVVVGKDINYVGTAAGENFFPEIKNDLEKLKLAGLALSLVEKMTRESEIGGSAEIFNLLKFFLENLESNNPAAMLPEFFSTFEKELAAIIGFSHLDFEELKRK